MRLIFATLDTEAKINLITAIFCYLLLTCATIAFLRDLLRKRRTQPNVSDPTGDALRALRETEAGNLLKQLGENPAEYSAEELAQVSRYLEIAKRIDVDTLRNGSTING